MVVDVTTQWRRQSNNQAVEKRVETGSSKVGEVLVSEGKISPEQLEEARAIQREDGRQLDEILISMGHVSKGDLAEALAKRLRLEYVEITEQDVDRSAATLVDRRVLRKHGVLPLRVEDGKLVVAMSDPTNFYALEDLSMLSGHPIRPVVALEDEIRRVFDRALAIGDEVTELLEEAAEQDSSLEAAGEVELGVDGGSEEAPIVKLVGAILQRAVGEGASDIHIEPRAKELTVRFRVDGVLREVMSVPLKLQAGVIARLKILGNLDIAERRVPQDGRFSVRSGGQKIDLRVASLPTVFGEKVVLRLLDTSSVEANLKKLGFAGRDLERFEEVYGRPYGAILVTGPTGSGKSTTLYATLAELNSPDKNIITVEDPVEYRMAGINQIQVNPKAGLTFASGLRSILRADPDVVMIGEIRDYETAKISVEAALTGHLVLATLHTNDAPAAVARLTEMGVEPFLTASAVDCVIAQRLARRLCERCKEPVEIERELLEALDFPFTLLSEGEEPLNFHKPVGCKQCGGTGYKGRVGIYELMTVDEEVKEMILKRTSAGEIAHTAEQAGMVRLREDGLLKAARSITTVEEVLRTVV
jgi:type IV pilus assembly protein PilB